MKKFLIFIVILLLIQTAYGQKVFNTNNERLIIKVNNKIITSNWMINKELKPDIFKVECTIEENTVTFSDEKDSVSFKIQKNQEIDFIILKSKLDIAYTRIVGIEPNVNFSKEYIQEHLGKTSIEIPEVSELVNIIMALHKDAEKDENMFDTKTDYYKKVRTHFSVYRNHPIFDTIQKYITDLTFYEGYDMSMFSRES